MDKNKGGWRNPKTSENLGYLLTEDRSFNNYDANIRHSKAMNFNLESRSTQFMFLAFGISLLLPWNATMASLDYFKEIFPSYKPDFTFLTAVSVPMLGMQLVSFILQTYIPQYFKLSTCLFINCLVAAGIALVP